MIIALVSLLLLSPDDVAGLSLHVSAANELDTKCVSLSTSSLKVAGKSGRGRAQVGLVSPVEDGTAGGLRVAVFLVLHDPGLNTRLDSLLFGVDQQADTTGDGEIADLQDRVVHGLSGHSLRLQQAEGVGAHSSEFQSDKVARLGHVDCLEGAFHPNLNLSQSDLGVVRGIRVLIDEDLTGISQEYTTAPESFDLVDRILDFELVLASVELFIDGVLDKHVQHWVFGDIPECIAGMSQQR